MFSGVDITDADPDSIQHWTPNGGMGEAFSPPLRVPNMNQMSGGATWTVPEEDAAPAPRVQSGWQGVVQRVTGGLTASSTLKKQAAIRQIADMKAQGRIDDQRFQAELARIQAHSAPSSNLKLVLIGGLVVGAGFLIYYFVKKRRAS